MRFTLHTGLKITPFSIHHCRKPRTELTNVMKTGQSVLSNWSEMFISANIRQKTPIHVTRNGDGEVTNHILMLRTKRKKRSQPKSHGKREVRLVTIPFNSSKRTITKNHSNVDFKFIYKRQ